MKNKLLVSVLNFLSLAVPSYLAQSKKALFSPRVPKIPKKQPSDLPKVRARTGCEDMDFTPASR